MVRVMAVMLRAAMPPAALAAPGCPLVASAVLVVTLRQGTAATAMPRELVVAMPRQATTLPAVPIVPVPMVLRLLAEPAMVQTARPTVPRVVRQTQVQAMLAAALVVSVPVAVARAASLRAVPRRTRTRVLPVVPRIAGPVVSVGIAMLAAEPAVLVVMPTAALAGMPTVVPVVPRTAVPAVTPMADPRALGTAAARLVVSVLEQLQRPMQRVTPPAVLVVLAIPEPVVQARVVPRRLLRLRVEQGLWVVPRTAVPAVQRLVVMVVPVEQGLVLPVPRVRVVLPLVA